MPLSGGSQPFKPSFGGKVLPIGCSDKGLRSTAVRDKDGKADKDGRKLTTSGRANVALELYWQQRAAAGVPPVGDHLPGGEKLIVQKTRDACWNDSVHLDHSAYQQTEAADEHATIADIEGKERSRTRGIPGFTGRQPPPGASKPPSLPTDESNWVAINAFDERRPRVKGIPGYTGHQPPAQPGPARTDTIELQHAQIDQQVHIAAAAPSTIQPHVALIHPSSSSTHSCCNLVASAANRTPPSAQRQQQHTRPYSSEVSSGFSPRFFMNGVEMPLEQLPSTAAAAATVTPAAYNSNEEACYGNVGDSWTAAAWCNSKDTSLVRRQHSGANVNVRHGAASNAVRPFSSPAAESAVNTGASLQSLAAGQHAQRSNRLTTYATAFTPHTAEQIRMLARPGTAAGSPIIGRWIAYGGVRNYQNNIQ